ncbi:MAG: hypothetical protein KAT79_02100 [candidate division Zixibacteria bacterium]|nr:hypothetical protein [candidate division Zixibacteria bacterium]
MAVSSTSMVIGWNAGTGLTYHVYRRMASSSGSFFRIDNPAGLLTDVGVVDSFYIDNTVDGVSSYDYLIIAEDGSGYYSPHSAVLTANSASVTAPVIASINPGNGPAVGGTPVDIFGSGFDISGVNPVVGSFSLTSITAISPFHISGVTQSGAIGLADVSVTNLSSGLISNILIGGFTYDANGAPVLAPIAAQQVTEGQPLSFGISATDPEAGIPVLTSSTLPGLAAFTDNLDGTGSFDWTPTYLEAGVYNVTFYATDDVDPLLVDSIAVAITVLEAGNQLPILNPIGAQTVAENGNLNIVIAASDPEGVFPTFSIQNIPANATFVDNLNGTGTFDFNPDFTQEGIYSVTFEATDDSLAMVSEIVQIQVTGTNQLPVLAAIGPQGTIENVLLSFVVSASDADSDIPLLSTSTLPGTALFTDNGDGTGSFDWTPTYAEAGIYPVTFYATDALFGSDVDSETVTITITEAGNQPPVLAPLADTAIFEGTNLNFAVTASDPDGNAPVLTAENLPANATFVINPDSSGTFDFNPDYTQAGLHPVTFIASDGTVADSQIVTITVNDAGNLPPVWTAVADTAISEGDTLIVNLSSTDPDGGLLILSVSTSLNSYDFVDNGDGTGILTYTPNFFDAGTDTVQFIAIDDGTPQMSATEAMEILTVEVNQAPAFDSIGTTYTVETGRTLNITVSATDSTDGSSAGLFMTSAGVPINATFVDNDDNSATFSFSPVVGQEGLHTVSFYATDLGTPQLTSTLVIDITVTAANQPPVLTPIGAQTVLEGATLTLPITATDPDGGFPVIMADKMPTGASFTDHGDGTAVFIFTPAFVQAGLHSVTFKADDGIALVKEVVLIQVYEAGNQVPQLTFIPAPQVTEGDVLEGIITAADPDSTPVSIYIDSSGVLLENFVLVDSGNGVASFTISPDFTQSGLYDISIGVSDGELADTTLITIDVVEAGNQTPVLDTIPDYTVAEGDELTFEVHGSDVDGTIPFFAVDPLPEGASFYDNTFGTGTFTWTPGAADHGDYSLWFYAVDRDDATLTDSQAVLITVTDVNFMPNVYPDPYSQNTTIFEGDTLLFRVVGSDLDGDIPKLGVRMSTGAIGDPLEPNMGFVDSANGVGLLGFIPDHTQGDINPSKYYPVFYAIDAADTTMIAEYPGVTINVYSRNFPPVLTFQSGTDPFTLNEGDNVGFWVKASDIDGVPPPTISAANIPANAVLYGSGDSVYFDFSPDFTQAGQYTVTFTATDNQGATVDQDVVFDVIEVGNQPPVFTTTLADPYDIVVNINETFTVAATDPESEAITLTVSPMVPNAFFSDFGDGTGEYSIMPDGSQLGMIYEVTFVATDLAMATDTLITNLRVVSLMRGDADFNYSYSMNDVVFLISYLFRGGPEPSIVEAGDVDNSGTIDVSDVAYLINYLYRSGPKPPQ